MTFSISILGSTGVIGRQTLSVLGSFTEPVTVAALAAGRNADLLAQQVRAFRPSFVSVQDEAARQTLLDALSDVHPLPEIGVGEAGLAAAAAIPSDVVVSAVVGARGLRPTWLAMERGATIALANKETLVAGGDLVMPLCARTGARIVPVDSEHSAVFQCLQAGRPDDVARYILTASGGPFRTWSQAQLERATVDAALRHPNWTMGQKITIDSATLMNKGLEVIEAHHLFDASYDKIEVVVHPQSVIHSMVEYLDGSILAQLGAADMRIPIQYALTYPRHRPSPATRLNLLELSELTFEAPDFDRFPSLRLAYEAGRAGGFAPCVLNAANEVAVECFLQGRMTFLQMAKLVESVLEQHQPGVPRELEEILQMDAWARATAHKIIEKGGWTS
ncbi:1-deoxy-D-xylulose-5-phosphate reductoisomerase [Alicyclobacillus cycloheptanicus]|uniref:1-deoxy-D-xylulose 5-phosphate reductoisomerase n=1 Tax=Alicyclobacillus cycloheptanicus TaxID=1457 RepID=A0ABT9XJR4_9BACL|nr:1-deoxy-D-xylulose-5-phosphate reductoisomerase [Alicyclobacillus cycloheptanicus]MDQ0190530.1 1-deoxy-D-xylulose-5-phosphate reductoisomerase [Alicyclobacillus cycloheptanicus]WDM01373.1 1-deoxy-D-xylulose-5-phosphate reductoisomerase [Alicyclobacillus cycloheptanicus]